MFNGNVFIYGEASISPAPLTYMSDNASFGIKLYDDMSTAVGENNVEYKDDVNPLFVKPSTGDYRIRDGVNFYDIPYEKIGRYWSYKTQ